MKQWVWQHEQRKTHTYICWKDLSGFFLKLCWKQHALHTVIYFALKSSIDKLPGWVFGSRVIENMPMTCNNDTCQHFAYWVWSSNLCERCSCTVKPTSMLLPLHSTGYSVQRTNEKCSSTHADHCWRSLASTGLPHCHCRIDVHLREHVVNAVRCWREGQIADVMLHGFAFFLHVRMSLQKQWERLQLFNPRF